LIIQFDGGALGITPGILLAKQHRRLRQPRLHQRGPGGIGHAHRHAEQGKDFLRQSEFGGDLFRPVAQAADITAAQPLRFQRQGGILRRQRRIDRRQQEGFEIVQSFALFAFEAAEFAHALEVGQPHQQQRRLCHMRLVSRQPRQAGFARGILDRNHAPDLEVGRGRSRLRRRDGNRQRAVRQGAREIGAYRAVRQKQIQRLVPGAACR
jgi:hypothetical protein